VVALVGNLVLRLAKTYPFTGYVLAGVGIRFAARATRAGAPTGAWFGRWEEGRAAGAGNLIVARGFRSVPVA
jgi:hypothetical protein